jgi:very-short-patch-repair endonuclease
MPNESAKGADITIAEIASRQHGVIIRRQLLSAGLLPSGISDRVAAGRLHRVHRGVYAVGHPKLSDRGRWIAAVLACGRTSVLSHRSAAELWGMLRPRSREVDVTVFGVGGRRGHVGVCLHRSSSLTTADCTRRDGIPVTKPARTLADLRRTFPSQVFATALREAEYLRLPVGGQADRDRTRSELESRFLRLLRRHRLPRPEVNVPLDGFVVDFLWPGERVIAELDGWQAHGTRSAFERDRARDARLKSLGFDVVRFTWRQLQTDPALIAATIRSCLDAAA